MCKFKTPRVTYTRGVLSLQTECLEITHDAIEFTHGERTNSNGRDDKKRRQTTRRERDDKKRRQATRRRGNGMEAARGWFAQQMADMSNMIKHFLLSNDIIPNSGRGSVIDVDQVQFRNLERKKYNCTSSRSCTGWPASSGLLGRLLNSEWAPWMPTFWI